MNQKYADINEYQDYELMKDFNTLLQLNQLGQTPYAHSYDASGYTKDNKYTSIELKRRYVSVLTYPSLIIEGHKLLALLTGFIYSQEIPLYINFMNDAVVVFNLSKLKTKPKLIEKKIKSKLYQAYDVAERYELQMTDAWIYRKEGDRYKLIQRPS